MAVYQGNYQSILGGVSQQVYTDRQPSQVETQVNMTSDTVRGLRKRPGSRKSIDIAGTDAEQWSLGNTGHLRQYTANLGWGVTSFIVNTITGKLTTIVETETVQLVGQSDYLVTPNPSDIVFATVGSTLYIGNCDVVPQLVTDETRQNPAYSGYFFVVAGGYARTYTCVVTTALGTYTASYTTPSASESADASDHTVASYIVGQLATQLNAQIGGATGLSLVNQVDGYLFLGVSSDAEYLNVSTSAGVTYAIASNTHTVDSTDDLPAQLPDSADGFIMTVGDDSFAQYFSWDFTNTRWVECGEYGSPTSIDPSTMPLVINSTSDTNQHDMATTTWGGRNAGNDLNNETPAFLDGSGVGITGLASFQGRLIIFSGPYISMGSSVKQYRNYFYRTTVTQVLDGDRIEFTSTSFSGANFRYGVPFNSDLILASDTHQGVIPGRNQVLTPNNATAVLTSTYQMDTDVSPQTSGRSLYYAYPRSNSSFAVKEMLPSGYTDLQYTSQDVTDHLPTYLEGATAYIASSTTNNIVVFGSSTETNTLYVNEYLWSGDSKVLSSWHSWTLDGVIHAAWFVRENLLLCVERAGYMHLLTVSMRDSPDPSDVARFLAATDYNLTMGVSDATGYSPYIQFATTGVQAQLWDLIQLVGVDELAAVVHTGAYIGAEVGIKSIDVTNRRLLLQPSYGTDTLLIGRRFTAQFAPTPPRTLDQNGGYVDVTKLIVQFYNLTLRYTSPFTITVTDRGGTVYDDTDSTAISYASSELNLGQAALDDRYKIKLRVGVEVESSYTLFESNTAGDFNLQGLGYILKFNNRIRRI